MAVYYHIFENEGEINPVQPCDWYGPLKAYHKQL